MSSEEEEEEVAEIVPTLLAIVEEFSVCHGRAKKLLASERRARRQEPEEMLELLQKLRGKLARVRDILQEVDEVPSEEKKKVVAKEKKKRARGGREDNAVPMVDEEVGGQKKRGVRKLEEEEEGEEGKEKEEEEEDDKAAPLVVKNPRAKKKLVDGAPCRFRDESGEEILVYFALLNKLDSESFECPLLSGIDEQSLVVERKQLEVVEFSTLGELEQARYLELLDEDILRRFKVNANVIFENHGKDMLNARSAVIEDPSKVDSWFASMAKDAIASNHLSAANNTVLILAASLHAKLAASGAQDWYAMFKKQMIGFCKNCSMAFSTVERYLKGGALMLRSPVLACMLPSFLVLNSAAIEMLSDDKEVVGRWEDKLFELESGANDKVNLMEIEIEGGDEEDQDEVVVTGEKEEEQCSNSPGLEMQNKGSAIEEGSPVASDDLGELHLGEEHLASSRPDKENDGPDDDFIHQIPGKSPVTDVASIEKVEEPVEARECQRCKQVVVFFLCDADDEEEHEFCWKCHGYKAAPPEELAYPGSEMPIRSYLFCREHIEHIESCKRMYRHYAKGKVDPMDLPNYVSFVQAEEARDLVRIFLSVDCQFRLVPSQPDGWCLFACVARAIDQSVAELIDGLKGFVDAFVKSRSRRNSVFVNKSRFRTLWKRLDVEDDMTVQELWAGEDGDLLLPMIAEHVKNVEIRIWNILNGELVKQPQVYGDGAGKTVNLLQTNVIVPHYDLMVMI